VEVKVVDASAVAAVLFLEPEAGTVRPRIAGAKLVAPTILEYELVNVCLKKMRRHPDFRPQWQQAHRLRARLRIEHVEVDFGDLPELADGTGLTAYDASYLWLARQLGAELVTLDRRLARAAATT
jgi:predicted nucleic acid-binding protein